MDGIQPFVRRNIGDEFNRHSRVSALFVMGAKYERRGLSDKTGAICKDGWIGAYRQQEA
jgi:hypothetical protein